MDGDVHRTEKEHWIDGRSNDNDHTVDGAALCFTFMDAVCV